jgi:hypothetical protein
MHCLYLNHWPIPSQGLFVGVWRALEKICAADRAGATGAFRVQHLRNLDTVQAHMAGNASWHSPRTRGRCPQDQRRAGHAQDR